MTLLGNLSDDRARSVVCRSLLILVYILLNKSDFAARASGMVAMTVLSEIHGASPTAASAAIHSHAIPSYGLSEAVYADDLDLFRHSSSFSSSGKTYSDNGLRDSSSLSASEALRSHGGFWDSSLYSASSDAYADLDHAYHGLSKSSLTTEEDMGFQHIASSSHATDSVATYTDDGLSPSLTSADDIGFLDLVPMSRATEEASAAPLTPYPEDRFQGSSYAFQTIVVYSAKAEGSTTRGITMQTRKLLSSSSTSSHGGSTAVSVFGAPAASPVINCTYTSPLSHSSTDNIRHLTTQKHLRGDTFIDPRYGVDKRLVPTGPNPLHN